jgi:hypothetical protein
VRRRRPHGRRRPRMRWPGDLAVRAAVLRWVQALRRRLRPSGARSGRSVPSVLALSSPQVPTFGVLGAGVDVVWELVGRFGAGRNSWSLTTAAATPLAPLTFLEALPRSQTPHPHLRSGRMLIILRIERRRRHGRRTLLGGAVWGRWLLVSEAGRGGFCGWGAAAGGCCIVIQIHILNGG